VLSQGFSDIENKHLQSAEDYQSMIDDALAGYGHFLGLVRDGAQPQEVLAAFGEYQLLCALREGPFGVSGLNDRIEQALVRQRRITRPAHARWYEGGRS
jgi:exodeoxyribonuclease V alpha subunit